LGTIADLIAHRRTTERLVRRVEQGNITAQDGTAWRMVAFESKVDGIEHLAMIKGDISGDEPVLVRMHGMDLLSDVLGSGHFAALQGAMRDIAAAGRGVVVIVREQREKAMSIGLRALLEGKSGSRDLRDYGIGAQILLDLGVKNMILLSNHKRNIIGLEGYGLNVVDQRSLATGESN
ncbi:MAG: 3,4-dihydroxy-2-butanone-4-phosphate synthase, partial [Rhodospirillales bacterium]|nr:3,4-dihydroxy-2-butanone-4-phosphate synthase [Rhodospirillales bacterium]